MSLPINLQFNGHWHIESGLDCVAAKGDCIKYYASRLLILTGKTGAKASGALDDFVSVLDRDGVTYRIFDGIRENPTFEQCLAAAAAADGFEPDGVLGIGGGSVMDAAKITAIILANPGITAEALFAGAADASPLPVIVCDTTAGTGSGITRYAILSVGSGSEARKLSYASSSIIPAICFCDPKYLEKLPVKVAQSTAIDIMAHCIEAYFHKKTGVLVRMYALAGLEMLWKPFCRACDGVLMYDDREQLLYASQLGGFAIELAGTCMAHSQGYGITVSYGVPHGFACGYTIADFLRLQATQYPDEVEKLLSRLGCGDVDALEDKLYSVLPRIELTASDIESLAKRGSSYRHLYNSMVIASPELSKDFYEKLAARMKK